MKLKYVHRVPSEGTHEVVAERDTETHPVPAEGDRVRVEDSFYLVRMVFHALDAAHAETFDEPDEVHACLVPLEQTDQIQGRPSP